jgi:hypothetical protein
MAMADFIASIAMPLKYVCGLTLRKYSLLTTDADAEGQAIALKRAIREKTTQYAIKYGNFL